MPITIGRRELIAALGGAAATWPLAPRAQELLVPVIGYMDTASASTTAHLVEAFRRGLSAAGYDEGRNVAIEYRWSEGDYDKLPALAAELVRRQVAVIATINTPTILAAKAATQTIPIIFGVGVDPIQFGLQLGHIRPPRRCGSASRYRHTASGRSRGLPCAVRLVLRGCCAPASRLPLSTR